MTGGRIALGAGAALFLVAALLFLPRSAVQPVPPSLAIAPASALRPELVLGRGTGRIVGAGQDFLPLAEYIEARLPLRCRIRIVSESAEYQRRVAAGEIDVAYLSALEYVAARERTEIEPVIAPGLVDGILFYHGLIVTTNPAIRSVQDLRGRRVTYVDDQSTSGFLFPIARLLGHGIDPERDFLVFEPSGSHENVLLNLHAGRYDAGFILENQRDRAEMAALRARVRTLDTTAAIPFGVLALSARFLRDRPALAASVRTTLRSLTTDTEGRKAIEQIFRGSTGSTTPRDEDYDEVRRVRALLRKKGLAT